MAEGTNPTERASVILVRALLDRDGDLWQDRGDGMWQGVGVELAMGDEELREDRGPVREALLVPPAAGRVLELMQRWPFVGEELGAAVRAMVAQSPSSLPPVAQPVPGTATVTVLVTEDGRCGCCAGQGEHPCGHECDSCDGAGQDPDSPVCTLPHGGDCRCVIVSACQADLTKPGVARALQAVGEAAARLITEPAPSSVAADLTVPTPEPDSGGVWEGWPDRECGDHRTTGGRAWCFECSEWCTPDAPCARCELPEVRGRLAAAEPVPVPDSDGPGWDRVFVDAFIGECEPESERQLTALLADRDRLAAVGEREDERLRSAEGYVRRAEDRAERAEAELSAAEVQVDRLRGELERLHRRDGVLIIKPEPGELETARRDGAADALEEAANDANRALDGQRAFTAADLRQRAVEVRFGQRRIDPAGGEGAGDE